MKTPGCQQNKCIHGYYGDNTRPFKFRFSLPSFIRQNFLTDILFDFGFIYPVFDLIKLKTKLFGYLWITQALKVSHKNDIELTFG